LDLKNASPARQDAKKWTIDESEDLALEDEEDLVEIVSTENRITGGRSTSTSGYRDDPNGGGHKDYPSLNNLPSPWSSRYSVDQYMTGGATTKEVLANLEKEEQRIAKSARNMFMTTAPTSPPSSPNLFGSSFSFRKSPSMSRDTNLRTMWSDNDLLTTNGRSLERPFPSSGGHGFEKARRRRRLCIVGSMLAVCLAVIGLSFIRISLFERKRKQEETARDRRRKLQRQNPDAGHYRPSGNCMRSLNNC
jgi:hypothetical protein